jgi:Family of unknown function (DUF5996)
MTAVNTASEQWPALPYSEWKDTYATLHMWTQIVGKIRLELGPAVNHWWHVTLYVSPAGLTTHSMPYGDRLVEIEFDLIRHELVVRVSDGSRRAMKLEPRSVAAFYRELMSMLASLGIDVRIFTKPQEVENPIPFEQDEQHSSYDPEYAGRFGQILRTIDHVFQEFRGKFLGKSSPVHFFWGSFDLAVTRFSGRPAPPRPGADYITRDAYSHEVISHGFWPGNAQTDGPAFYSYTAPAPDGLATAKVNPPQAFYSNELGEFLLMYDDVRKADQPEAMLLDFMQSTYDAGSTLANWDRDSFEYTGPR